MEPTASRRFLAAAVALAVAVLVLGWFLFIAPRRSQAAALRQDGVAQEAVNTQLRARAARLQAQERDLPAQEARLAELREAIPEEARLPELVTALTGSARKSGVELVSITPQPLQPAQQGQDPAPQAGLQRLPVSVTVRGDYFAAQAFLRELEELPRALLVGRVALTGDEAEAAGSGRVEMVVDAAAFVASTTSASPPQVVPGPSTTPDEAPAALERHR